MGAPKVSHGASLHLPTPPSIDIDHRCAPSERARRAATARAITRVRACKGLDVEPEGDAGEIMPVDAQGGAAAEVDLSKIAEGWPVFQAKNLFKMGYALQNDLLHERIINFTTEWSAP